MIEDASMNLGKIVLKLTNVLKHFAKLEKESGMKLSDTMEQCKELRKILYSEAHSELCIRKRFSRYLWGRRCDSKD